MITAASTYYVKRLVENPVNQFKWLYIDGSDGNLKIIENKWYFDINFYLINNLFLPTNTFNVNLSTQFTQISDISINAEAEQKAPDWVTQKDYCTKYTCTFEIDTNDSKLFQDPLTNYSILLNFSLNIDNAILDRADVGLDQYEYNEFISEIYQQKIQTKFLYSNYEEKDNKDSTFNISNSYYLNSKLGSYSEDQIIYYSMNNETDQIDEPIKKLLIIQFEDNYTILSKKVHFIYQVYGHEQNELTYEVTTPEYGDSTKEFTYDFCTYFSEPSGKVENQNDGVNGFYCPLATTGYYQISIKVLYKNVIKTLKFINNFSFKGNDDYKNKKLQVMEVFIDNINYFKEVVF